MLDTKIDTTPYKDVIVSAQEAIANVGRTYPRSHYREACEEILSNLYLSLERLGTPDNALMMIAADFVDVVNVNRPLAYAA